MAHLASFRPRALVVCAISPAISPAISRQMNDVMAMLKSGESPLLNGPDAVEGALQGRFEVECGPDMTDLMPVHQRNIYSST